MHNVPYARHPGYQKTITAVRDQYYWPGMKKNVANFIARCMECQKLKAEHRHPMGLLQPLPIPEWKWKFVTSDFNTKLSRTTRQHDSIMAVVDKLMKDAHFIPVRMMHKATNIAEIYMKEITKLHGVPKEIISNRDTKFTSNFWKGLFKGHHNISSKTKWEDRDN
jgi:hypothetical protein